jgi:beta-xylosidase
MNPLAYREIRSGKDAAVLLRIITDKDKYSVYYSGKGFSWQLLARGIDGRFLSTSTGGFVGSVFRLYATTHVRPPSGGKTHYDWFEYKDDDETLK